MNAIPIRSSSSVRCIVNGRPVTLEVRPEALLLDVLRDRLQLKGARRSCDMQVCGACTVLVDGAPVSACTYLAVQYHLALHRWRFIAALVVGAVAQPVVLVAIGAHLTSLALGLVTVNGSPAVTTFVLALRARPALQAVEIDEEPAAPPAPALSVE